DHVDPRPEVPVDDPAVGGKAGAPLVRVVAEQVVDLPRPELRTLDRGGGIGAEEAEPEVDAPLLLREGENRLPLREPEARPARLRREAYARVRLPPVGDEGERQRAVGRERLLLRGRRGGRAASDCLSRARRVRGESLAGAELEQA